MIESGMDLNSVMYIKGHKKIKMIMIVYDSVRLVRVQE